MRRPTQFHLTSHRQAREMIIRACGRFTLGQGAVEAFWTGHLNRAGSRTVALDLANVTVMDARGLGVLASLTRDLRHSGKSVSVSAASSVVARLASLTRLDTVLPGSWQNRFSDRGCLAEAKLSPENSAATFDVTTTHTRGVEGMLRKATFPSDLCGCTI